MLYMVKYNGVLATLTFPSGDTIDNIPVSVKVFSSGRHGYFAQIAKTVIDGEEFNGQIQVWNLSKEFTKAKK